MLIKPQEGRGGSVGVWLLHGLATARPRLERCSRDARLIKSRSNFGAKTLRNTAFLRFRGAPGPTRRGIQAHTKCAKTLTKCSIFVKHHVFFLLKIRIANVRKCYEKLRNTAFLRSRCAPGAEPKEHPRPWDMSKNLTKHSIFVECRVFPCLGFALQLNWKWYELLAKSSISATPTHSVGESTNIAPTTSQV